MLKRNLTQAILSYEYLYGAKQENTVLFPPALYEDLTDLAKDTERESIPSVEPLP